IITVMHGFYAVYHRAASGLREDDDDDLTSDSRIEPLQREDLARFRAFLRSLAMHAVVGTALGGVTTLVGEPQNVLIGTVAGWEFVEFFVRMLPISAPVLGAGLLTCALLERFRLFGYGAPLPEPVRAVLENFARGEVDKRTAQDHVSLVAQALVVVFLVLAL